MKAGKTIEQNIDFLSRLGFQIVQRGSRFNVFQYGKLACKRFDAEDLRLFAAGVNHGVLIGRAAN